jgi:hypothetical protein
MLARLIDPSVLGKLKVTSAAQEQVYKAMTAETTDIKGTT